MFGPFPCCYCFPFFLSRNHEWPAQPKILSQNKCAQNARVVRIGVDGGDGQSLCVELGQLIVVAFVPIEPTDRLTDTGGGPTAEILTQLFGFPLTCCRYIIRFVIRNTRIPILIWSYFSLFFLICPWKEVSPVLRVPTGGQLHCCPTNSRKIILEYSNISRSLTAGSLVNFCLWYPSKLKSAPLFIATASPHRCCLLLLSFAFSFCA